jgi:hypothetical protein
MTTIRVQPGNALDFEEDDLEALADAIRATSGGTAVETVSKEQWGRAVTWWEVVDFLLTEGAGHVVDAVIGAAIMWARQRLKRKKDAEPDRQPRPVWVTLYGPDGGILKSVQITDPDNEPSDVTEAERERVEAHRRAEAEWRAREQRR